MTRPKSVLRTGLAAAFIVTAAFIPVSRAHASVFTDYTAPRDADIDARGAKSIEVRAEAGSLRIEGRPGITQVQVRGTARASERNRRVRVSDGSGEIRAKNIVGDFIVDEDGSGSIDVAGVGGSMRVEEDGSGGIDVDRVAGDFTVDHKGSGSISSSGVRGKTDIPDRHRRRGGY